VELEGGRCKGVKAVRVPRSVPILRLPDEPAPLPEVLARLAKLPPAPLRETRKPDLRPWLEVRVRLEGSEFGYQGEIAEALEGRDARLVKITPQRTGSGEPLVNGSGKSLSDLTPEKVFRKLWERGSSEPLPAELEAAFHELVDVASQEERS
jgi:exonuclease SbcD